MSRTIQIEGLRNTIKKLENQRRDIEKKSKQVLNKLADKGISVAKEAAADDTHHFSEMVVFKKEWEGGYLCLVGANDNLGKLRTQWYDSEGNYHTETISPILALEYGTAGLAIEGNIDDRGGRGKAAVTKNHTSDTSWYYYEDAKKNHRHKATAEEPHEPMYKAFLAMKRDIQLTISEVFGHV